MNIGLQLFQDSTMTVMVADLTHIATVREVTTDERGFGTLVCFVPMTQQQGRRFYDGLTSEHVFYGDEELTIFSGRLEDKELLVDGVELAAEGYWAALFDVAYSGLWSVTAGSGKWGNWQQTTEHELADARNQKWVMNKDFGRLYASPRPNESYLANSTIASWNYQLPIGSSQDLAFITGHWYARLPSAYSAKLRLIVRGEGWSGSDTTDLHSATDSPADSTFSYTVPSSGRRIVEFQTLGTSGTWNTVTEIGSYYARVQDLRILTGASSTLLYADEIVKALVAAVNSVNPLQLSASAGLIDSPSLDLKQALWEDKYVGDIVKDLILRGDNQTPPRYWEAGVWERQEFFFRPRGSAGAAYFTDIASIEMNASLATMYNQTYATYDTAGPLKGRTAVSDDAGSQAKYNLVRTKHIGVRGESANAAAVQDALLAESAASVPRARITCQNLSTENGADVPVQALRAGDKLTLRNLSAYGLSDLADFETFIVSKTRYLPKQGRMIPEPEYGKGILDIIINSNQ
jgi:hypothetical protein